MLVLVINAGSSSLKYQLLNADRRCSGQRHCGTDRTCRAFYQTQHSGREAVTLPVDILYHRWLYRPS